MELIPGDFVDGILTLFLVMAWAIRGATVDPDLCCHMTSLGHSVLEDGVVMTQRTFLYQFCMSRNGGIML